MLKVLKIPIQKYSDKRKTASVEQRITTISRELDRKVNLQEVIKHIKQSFADAFEIAFADDEFSSEEKTTITKLEKERYLSDDWIFQRSPQLDMTGMSLKKTPAGLLRTYIGLKGETIKSVLITGDFFEQAELFSKIESELKWSSMDKENIQKVVTKVFQLEEFDTLKYGLSADQIIQSIWLAAQRAMTAERYTYKGSCYYPKTEAKETTLKEI